MGLDVTKKVMMEGRSAAEATLHSLSDIVNDLWGRAAEASAETPASPYEIAPMGGQSAKAEALSQPDSPAPSAAPKPVAPMKPKYEPTFPSFNQLWKTADETVDWTEALVKTKSPDPAVSDHLWSFFHEHASAVLEGNMDAYLEVLEAANPLGDMKPYARSFEIGAEDADTLVASFACEPAYLKVSPDEEKRYYAGVSLRIARDLMALLPVSKVTVYAQLDGENKMVVTWPRSVLQQVRFGFVDPTALAMECGAEFS